jgi:acyl carrier protein
MPRSVVEIIAAHFEVPVEQVAADKDVTRDLAHGDSLQRVELVMAVEDEFGIEISNEDAEPLRTVQQFIDYVDCHVPDLGGQRAA